MGQAKGKKGPAAAGKKGKQFEAKANEKQNKKAQVGAVR